MWNRHATGPSIVLLVIALFLPASAPAAPGGSLGAPMRPGDAEAGTLLLESANGMRPAPTVSTDVEIQVTGMIARTRVVQRFHNPTPDWVEGVYVFPLPEKSAVDTLRLIVGDRILEGEVQTRAQAKATYQQAKSEGRKASLLEQERPNVFTTSVANLGPGEKVEVAIEYQEDLRYDQRSFELRFPMVVGTKYIPGVQKVTGFAGTGWAENTTAVPDAKRVTPPVAHPHSGRTHPVTMRVTLDPGFPLARVESASHAIAAKKLASGKTEIRFAAGQEPANADFVLGWTPAVGSAPGAALFHERLGGESYVLLMVLPPGETESTAKRLPRETVFVIDTSGSMEGASIVQAKAALDLALSRLDPGDRFNVIEFNSVTRALFPASVPADPDRVAEARQKVSRLTANGGTEMLPALRAALAAGEEHPSVRQVVFITDGAVGNEAQLFQTIRQFLGKSRLFTVGIGSAPNSHFMSKAADFGRGTFTYIGSPSEVKEKMGGLFAKLESPVLHDLAVSFDAKHAEVWPSRVPDLYLGEPVVVVARLGDRKGSAVLKGRRGDEPLVLDMPVTGGAEHAGIARLWARKKVAALMSSLHEGANPAEVKDAVSELGIRHHLVTRYTSLVAVDVTPTAPVDVESETRAVPSLLPKGWSFKHLFGGGEDKAVRHANAKGPARQSLLMQPVQPTLQGRLPQGATPAALLFWLGAICVGAAGVVARRGNSR